MEKVRAMTASVVGYMMRTALHNNRKLKDEERNKEISVQVTTLFKPLRRSSSQYAVHEKTNFLFF